jgi:hypothetical protein
MATTTPASPILWLLGGLVPGLIIGTLLTWLYLNSRKRKTSPESGSDPLSDEKLDEPKEEVEETAEADPMLSQHSSQPVLLPVTPVPVANKYAAFVDDYEQAGKLFQQSLLLMNGEAKIVQVLKKVVIGTGAEGLLGHAAAWRKKQEAGPLNLDDVLTELAGRETAANLAWLARLHLVTKIDAVKDYFEDQGVNLPALHNYSNTIFDLLNRDLGLEFVCPQPGEHFDEVKYDLVMSNIGALSGLDGGALKRVLQNWQPPTNRPIYDVGELALSQQGTYESKLLPNFPSRTTVAYYSKH